MLREPSTRTPGAAVQGRRRRSRQGLGAPPTPPGPPSALGSAEGPARTHLASSSSGVSGHFAAKLAVTDLDAETVPERSSESHRIVDPRSSCTTVAAFFAMARGGRREPLAPGARSRHATADSSRRSVAHFRRGELESVTLAGAWRVPGACASRARALRDPPQADEGRT